MKERQNTDHSDVLDLFPELIFEIDKKLNVRFLNQSCENILGYTRKDNTFFKLPIEKLFTPKDLIRVKDFFTKHSENAELSGDQYSVYHKNQDEIILEFKKVGIIQNENGRLWQIIATPVTGNENNQFKHVFDKLPIPYQSLDKKGNILNINPEWTNRLGYGRTEVIGKSFKSFISDRNKHIFDSAYAKYIGAGRVTNAQVTLLTKRGKQISVNYIGKVEFTSSGDFLCTHCVFNDITEQQESTKSLKESERRLRDLNSTKDKFFSIIAHDLKNPFNDIMGFTQLLGLNIETYDKPKIKQFVNIIHQSSRLAYNLLENLLNWSRSQTGMLKFRPEKILINNLVHENILLLESTASNKNIKIYSELDIKIYAFADENMVRTIIRNLISNAIKYTNQGGYINIRNYCTRKLCEISISDTGIGIERADLNKIFKIEEGFTTIGTEKEKGTGLGLILCKEFVEKNGGQIWVKSEPNKGSTFTFTLPLPEPEFMESDII